MFCDRLTTWSRLASGTIGSQHDRCSGVCQAEPGKGAALHSHLTAEVFTPLSGQWAIIWGDHGENEVLLEAWDTISVPPGVMRGFRNVGRESACLMAILGGTDPGRVTWPREVLEKAKKTGLKFDAHGNVIQS